MLPIISEKGRNDLYYWRFFFFNIPDFFEKYISRKFGENTYYRVANSSTSTLAYSLDSSRFFAPVPDTDWWNCKTDVDEDWKYFKRRYKSEATVEFASIKWLYVSGCTRTIVVSWRWNLDRKRHCTSSIERERNYARSTSAALTR